MKRKLAKEKYINYWDRMLRHMEGITVSVDDDGDIDIPESDLERAYQLVTKGRSHIAWD